MVLEHHGKVHTQSPPVAPQPPYIPLPRVVSEALRFENHEGNDDKKLSDVLFVGLTSYGFVIVFDENIEVVVSVLNFSRSMSWVAFATLTFLYFLHKSMLCLPSSSSKSHTFTDTSPLLFSWKVSMSMLEEGKLRLSQLSVLLFFLLRYISHPWSSS